jgi:acetyltransferase-like isoleucine patch superfamily enzyme
MSFLNKIFNKKKVPDFPGVEIGYNCQFIGIDNISIGKGTSVGDNSWINVCIRDDKKRLFIGETVLIGRQSMISSADVLEIGDYNVFAPRVYISNTDHRYEDITKPILLQGIPEDRKMVIEENCWFGINTVIMGGINIGRGSVIAANTVVNRSLPAFVVAAGNPFKIVKMYNSKSQKWDFIKSEKDIETILEYRKTHPLISRVEYNKILHESNFSMIDPLIAGRNAHI